MIDSLAAAVTVFALVVAVVVLVRRDRSWPLVSVLEIALVAQAIVALVRLAGGHRVGEPGPFVAYLVVSVLVFPVVALQVRSDGSRWATALVAVAAVAVSVVVVRAQTTWRA